MSETPSDRRISAAFGLLEKAALAGDRCPRTHPHGPIANGAITALFEAGLISSEVYARNWRVVTILDGPNCGASTAPSPLGGAPYLVNGQNIERIRRRAGKIVP